MFDFLSRATLDEECSTFEGTKYSLTRWPSVMISPPLRSPKPPNSTGISRSSISLLATSKVKSLHCSGLMTTGISLKTKRLKKSGTERENEGCRDTARLGESCGEPQGSVAGTMYGDMCFRPLESATRRLFGF